MPKRDAAYMRAQREMIARAALQVLLEKGVYDTSLRDICKAAGVSMGAIYTHFATKEEIVVAACELDHREHKSAPLPETWDDYIASLVGLIPYEWSEREQKRFRLSLQFAAEVSVMERNPEGLSTVYLLYRERLVSCLRHLAEKGFITLPFGLENTTEMHMQIIAGAGYQVACDRDLPREKVVNALTTALGVTAGLVAQPAKPDNEASEPALP